ncbi:MAG: hypothetical protein AABY64_01975, partial [Bdellovibrionota bacterium]
TSLQLFVVVLVILYVWGYFRSDFAITLIDKAEERLKEKAVSIGGLTKKTANESNVRKKIRENRKNVTEMRAAQGLYQMNSALEMLKRVSENAPEKSAIKMDLKKFHVIEDEVIMEGYVFSRAEANTLVQSLNALSINGKIQPRTPTIPMDPKKTTFAISFKVDRNIHKVGL